MRSIEKIDVGELGLIEIRIDIKMVERKERRDIMEGGKEVEIIEGKIEDKKVERREKDSKRKIEWRIIEGKLKRFSRDWRLIILRLEKGNIGIGGWNLRI